MLKFVSLMLCMTVVVLAARPPSKLPLAGHRLLMDFMVQSRDASQENPARSLSCFNYYVPLLNDITAEYERSYGVCLNRAENAYVAIDNETLPQRSDIESDAEAACTALADCAKHGSSIDYFSCFNVEGSYNSRTMYNISANAGETLLTVREAYRLVETEQFRCTNASERAYVENTASTYEEMQACLQGKSPVPTPTEPTTTTPAPQPSSTEPTTTTPAPQPSSTEPTTTTPAPQPSSTEPTTVVTEPTTAAVPRHADGMENHHSRTASKGKWQSILGKFKNHIY